MSEVTRILSQIEQGDHAAAEELLPLIYDELRRLAARKLAQEKPGQTLEATALVHEAYVRLVDTERASHWNSRGHFFVAAAESMRRILVETARRKRRIAHGGQWQRIAFEDCEVATNAPSDDVLALDESLRRLEEHDLLAARLVNLRYFAGMTMPQAADALGIPLRTAERNWTYARTWLHRDLR